MIISCSRRTDIPALYATWFMNRIAAGLCVVPNPFNPKQISVVSLEPSQVDAIVFWSKNPEPMRAHLTALRDRGFVFYFQYTVNGYPSRFEPGIPPLSQRLDTFEKLAAALGPWGVIWRYDPIVVSNVTDWRFHERTFSQICRRLCGTTRRVMISFLDRYAASARRLSALDNVIVADRNGMTASADLGSLLRAMADIATECGMEIQSCAEAVDTSRWGIFGGKCIDDAIIARLGGEALYRKDRGQRALCLCTQSRDIGMNDTCTHGCVYCYATRRTTRCKERHREHDPCAPVLCGRFDLDKPDRIG